MKLNTFPTLLAEYDFPEGVKLLSTELELLNASNSVQGNLYEDYSEYIRNGECIAISIVLNNEHLIQVYDISYTYFLLPSSVFHTDATKGSYTHDGQRASSAMQWYEHDVLHDIHAFIAKKYGDREDFDWVLFSDCYALDK